jgi:hypothetical protein
MKGLEYFLEKNYILIKSFPQGTGVFFEIWLNKKESDEILF